MIQEYRLWTVNDKDVWVAILGVHMVAIIKAVGGTRLIIAGIGEYANR